MDQRMKALVFKRYGRPEQIVFDDIPKPTPKPGEWMLKDYKNPLDKKK